MIDVGREIQSVKTRVLNGELANLGAITETYIKEYAKLEADNKRLREALVSIEYDAGGYCNSCMGHRQHHDCIVAKALEGSME